MAPMAQRRIDKLLSKYAESHRHPKNETIHIVCVPVIVFSLLGLLWSLHPLIAIATVVLSLIYYATLSIGFMLGMLLMLAMMLGALLTLPQNWVLPVSVGIFVIAWIGQFIGHHIEGKKPSFFEDLRFLLIGPLFVLRFLYRRLQIAY